MKQIKCHDCKRELKEGEEYMKYDDIDFYKCKACHQKDPTLRNYQETEYYSRIVGYYRPIKAWNKGKSEEYKDRKEFKIKK